MEWHVESVTERLAQATADEEWERLVVPDGSAFAENHFTVGVLSDCYTEFAKYLKNYLASDKSGLSRRRAPSEG